MSGASTPIRILTVDDRRIHVFNVVIINDRNTNVIYRSPTDLTIVNSQYLADGSLDPARLTPRNAVRRRYRRAADAAHAVAGSLHVLTRSDSHPLGNDVRARSDRRAQIAPLPAASCRLPRSLAP